MGDGQYSSGMTTRMKRAKNLSTVLENLEDAQVEALINDARSVGVGIGGTTKVAKIG